MKRFDISQILFYTVLTVTIVGGAFIYGLYSGAQKNRIYKAVDAFYNEIFKSSELVVKESSTLTKTHPSHFLQPARYEGQGVTINKTGPNRDDLILMAGFFDNDNQLRLMDRNGSVKAKWPVKFFDIFKNTDFIDKPPATNWNVDMHGSLALPDGSVLFNFEDCGLVKLDRCGNLVWKLERETHHSVERAEGGGFWVPGRRHYKDMKESPFLPFIPPFIEDTILKVSEDGRILKEISVPGIFYKNGLEGVLTATGHWFDTIMGWDREIVHLNAVTELPREMAADFPMFAAGDLALSIRELNLVMVIDPNTEKVKWWRIGPWIRQHDPEFKKGGFISVFNNNCYRTAFGKINSDKSPLDAPRISNIIEVDPAIDPFKPDQFNIAYGQKKGQEMLSIIRGKHKLTAAGGIFITEFEGGRVFEVDKNGDIIWEYINRFDSDEVAEITEARIYPKDYFTVNDWTDCKEGDR